LKQIRDKGIDRYNNGLMTRDRGRQEQTEKGPEQGTDETKC
jgi:hypothetical protein